MILLDKKIFDGIFDITTDILKNNFFYDHESLLHFTQVFTDVMANEYTIFIDNTDDDFKLRLRFDLLSRKYFTSYFVSHHLHTILTDLLHFSDQELYQFENILPKFVGGNHVKQRHERKNH